MPSFAPTDKSKLHSDHTVIPHCCTATPTPSANMQEILYLHKQVIKLRRTASTGKTHSDRYYSIAFQHPVVDGQTCG